MVAERLRVLIVNLPDMLSEVLQSEFDGDREFEVLIEREQSEWTSSIGRFRPLVVIAGCSDAMVSYLARPSQLYLISADASTVRHIKLYPVIEEIGNVSPQQLAASIKAVVARREH